MNLRTILLGAVLLGCTGGALLSPVWPLVGYILHYSVGPERQWWAGPINALGIRYSFTFAILAMAAMAINHRNLCYGKVLFNRTEWLMLGFLAVIWLLTLTMAPTVGRYATSDHPSTKLTKVLIFVFLLTHVATTRPNLDIILWAIVLGGLIVGIQAYEKPYGAFVGGRLEGVGGPDFADSNRLAGYMVGVLPIIGVLFVRSQWRGRVLCFLAGGFAANTIVLTRCRGAVVGLFCAALIMAAMVPRKNRGKVIVGLLAGTIGFYFLTDDHFLRRASTITASAEERDGAAQTRIMIASAALKMLDENPLGVGPGNFYQNIGRYDSRCAGRDAHNTFVRCFGELGLPGILLFLGIFASTSASLRRILRESHHLPEEHQRYFHWTVTGLAAGIAGAFGYGLTGTLLYTEYAWWLLALPICLERVLNNVQEDLADEAEEQLSWRSPVDPPLEQQVT